MKAEITFPGSFGIKAEVTSIGLLAIHKTLDGSPGYIITHLPTQKVVMWVRRLKDAKEIVKELEALDELQLFRSRVRELDVKFNS